MPILLSSWFYSKSLLASCLQWIPSVLTLNQKGGKMDANTKIEELRENFRQLLAELSIEEIMTNVELMEQVKQTHELLYINDK